MDGGLSINSIPEKTMFLGTPVNDAEIGMEKRVDGVVGYEDHFLATRSGPGLVAGLVGPQNDHETIGTFFVGKSSGRPQQWLPAGI